MRVREIKYGDQWPLNLPYQEDPVRPELDREFRHTAGREVYTNGGAIICVAYCRGVPSTVGHLDTMTGLDHAVFYTVWSYSKGAGREIIIEAAKHIKKTKGCTRFVTLSPLTRMAERFHLRNGAVLLNKGDECQNFEYEDV